MFLGVCVGLSVLSMVGRMGARVLLDSCSSVYLFILWVVFGALIWFLACTGQFSEYC